MEISNFLTDLDQLKRINKKALHFKPLFSHHFVNQLQYFLFTLALYGRYNVASNVIIKPVQIEMLLRCNKARCPISSFQQILIITGVGNYIQNKVSAVF